MPDQDPYLQNLPVPAPITFRQLPAQRPNEPEAMMYPDPGLPRQNGFDALHLRELWRIVRKRKWLILAIVLVATTYAAIDTFRTKDRYQASVIIEIGQETTRFGTGSEVFLMDEDSLLTSMRTNELVLRSAPLLEEVVEELQLDRLPRFMDAAAPKKPMGQAFKDLTGLGEEQTPAEPGASTILIKGKVGGGDRSVNESERLEQFVSILEGGLNVTPIRDTRDMTIAFTHTDPVLAAGIANSIAERFVQSSFDKKVEKFTAASDWLDRSTQELKAKIETSERALADFTRINNIYAIEVETFNSERLSRLHDGATRAETERILKESLYQQVREGRIAQVPEAFADPQTVALQKTLNDLLIQASGLNVTYGPRYPKLAEITQQIETIQSQITSSRRTLEDKLKADYERAVRDEQALKDALTAAKSDASQENQLSIQYSLLKQDVDTTRALYKEFLQKTNQADLEVAQQDSSIRVIAPARVPKGPVGPNRQRAIVMAILLSLSAAVGLAFLMERFDDTIRNVDQVNSFTQLPALAIIPSIGASSSRYGLYGRKRKLLRAERLSLLSAAVAPDEMHRGRVVEQDSKSPVAEAYRALRTSVLLSVAGKSPRTILVTSVHSSEGKTTTATNTAISLSQLGASVLLLDCDLRKPTTHEVFGVPRGLGLSSYLAGDADLDAVIQDLPPPNLSLISAGPTPMNPSELLSSDGMRRLLKELGERFDHVVIDSPPLGSVTDPVILSTMVDGVILVVHSGKSSRQTIQRACRELAAVGSRIFGIVLNNVNLRREGYGDHYYYSYYKGYSEEDKRYKG